MRQTGFGEHRAGALLDVPVVADDLEVGRIDRSGLHTGECSEDRGDRQDVGDGASRVGLRVLCDELDVADRGDTARRGAQITGDQPQ